MSKTHYILYKDYRSFESFVDAVCDFCGGCARENCKWFELQISYKVWKKSNVRYFACDRFLEVKENGEDKRDGKSGACSQLDFDFLS